MYEIKLYYVWAHLQNNKNVHWKDALLICEKIINYQMKSRDRWTCNVVNSQININLTQYFKCSWNFVSQSICEFDPYVNLNICKHQ